MSFTALAVVGVVLVSSRRARWSTRIPYGPYLIVATLVVIAAHGLYGVE